MGHSESGPTTEMLHEGVNVQHGDESVLLFRAGDVPCCVDLSQLEELTRLPATTRVPLAPPWVTGLFNHRSNVVPAIDLRRCLGLPSAELGTGFLLLSGIDGERVAFWVDEVLDIVTPAEESWQELPPTAALPYCDHVLVTKDAIYLFLNLAKLLEVLQERRRTGASDSSSVSQLLETVRSGRLGESWAASRSSVRIQHVSSAPGGVIAADTDAEADDGNARPSTASPGGVFAAVAAKAAELRAEEAERAAASLAGDAQLAPEPPDAPETIAANLTEGRELEIVPSAPAESSSADRADAHQDVPQEQQPSSTALPPGVFTAVAAKAAELRAEEAERAAASLAGDAQLAPQPPDAPETIAANLSEGRELEIVPAAPAERPAASRDDAHQLDSQVRQSRSTGLISRIFASIKAKAAELWAEEAERAGAQQAILSEQEHEQEQERREELVSRSPAVGPPDSQDAVAAAGDADEPASTAGARDLSSETTATSAETSAETPSSGQEPALETEDWKVDASEQEPAIETEDLPVEFGETVTLTVAEESGPETKTPEAANADFAGRVESSSSAKAGENAAEDSAVDVTAEESSAEDSAGEVAADASSAEDASPVSALDGPSEPEHQLSASEPGGEDLQAAAAGIAAATDVSADETAKDAAAGAADGETISKKLVWAKSDSERKLVGAQPWAVFPMSRKSGAPVTDTAKNSAATPQGSSPGEQAPTLQVADNVWMAPAPKKKAKAPDSSSQEDAANVPTPEETPARTTSAAGSIPALDLADDSYEALSPREPEENTEKEEGDDGSPRWLLVAAIPLGIIALAAVFLFATRGSGPARPGAQVQPPTTPEVEPAAAGPVDAPESGSAEGESFSTPVVVPSAAGSLAAPIDLPLESPAEPPKIIGVIEVDGVRHDILYGDTLSKISGRYLGDIMRYPELADYNEIPNPDLIFEGSVIRIPPRRKEENPLETGLDDDQ